MTDEQRFDPEARKRARAKDNRYPSGNDGRLHHGLRHPGYTDARRRERKRRIVSSR